MSYNPSTKSIIKKMFQPNNEKVSDRLLDFMTFVYLGVLVGVLFIICGAGVILAPFPWNIICSLFLLFPVGMSIVGVTKFLENYKEAEAKLIHREQTGYDTEIEMRVAETLRLLRERR